MPQSILKKAAETIEARGKTHGDFQENFTMCAEMWSAYLRMPIAPAQVGVMMALLKFSRDQCGDGEPEHLLDAVGYAALAGAVTKPG